MVHSAVTLQVSSRQRRLLLIGAVVVAIGMLAVSLFLPSGDTATARRALPDTAAVALPPSPEASSRQREYALALPDVRGLPSNTRPGTLMELWVTWEPPVTKRPRVQRLIDSVTLSRIVPNVVPGEPSSAILLVQRRDLPRLLYADRYGRLNAALVP